ncbi:serine/arginine repetitive matrix protein 1-like [Schistocerca piceifrons]|uniref:serine/arginine repetitive matrix protein 1-like n=1 Tax=Schistocerca piceifrons TaxID=274613 RepID=UPI001F5E9E98|nr:serine/arginine repetitive matrix protein 1-like [Schistocerca piceifrons]
MSSVSLFQEHRPPTVLVRYTVNRTPHVAVTELKERVVSRLSPFSFQVSSVVQRHGRWGAPDRCPPPPRSYLRTHSHTQPPCGRQRLSATYLVPGAEWSGAARRAHHRCRGATRPAHACIDWRLAVYDVMRTRPIAWRALHNGGCRSRECACAAAPPRPCASPLQPSTSTPDQAAGLPPPTRSSRVCISRQPDTTPGSEVVSAADFRLTRRRGACPRWLVAGARAWRLPPGDARLPHALHAPPLHKKHACPPPPPPTPAAARPLRTVTEHSRAGSTGRLARETGCCHVNLALTPPTQEAAAARRRFKTRRTELVWTLSAGRRKTVKSNLGCIKGDGAATSAPARPTSPAAAPQRRGRRGSGVESGGTSAASPTLELVAPARRVPVGPCREQQRPLRPEQVADRVRPSKQKRRRRSIGESEEKPRCERRAPRSATGRRPGTAGAASHSLTAEKFPKIIVSFKINRRYPGRLPDLRCGLRRPRPRLCRRRRWRCARAAALRSPAAPHHRADVGALPSPDPPRPSPSAGTPPPPPGRRGAAVSATPSRRVRLPSAPDSSRQWPTRKSFPHTLNVKLRAAELSC